MAAGDIDIYGKFVNRTDGIITEAVQTYYKDRQKDGRTEKVNVKTALDELDDKIGNIPVPTKDRLKGLITLDDLLALTDAEEDDTWSVFKSGGEEEGWSPEEYDYGGKKRAAGTFFVRANNTWVVPDEQPDFSSVVKMNQSPESIYLPTRLYGSVAFPNLYGVVKTGITVANFSAFTLVDGVYKPLISSNPRSQSSTWSMVVPYARYYTIGQQGGEIVYEPGALTAADYELLIKGVVRKQTGKDLSTNDYTDAEKSKLAGIEAGAEVNVQPNWLETNINSDAYIQNKPTKVSDFENDANYAKKSEVPTKTSDLTNDSGFLTQHQDISGKQDKLIEGLGITIEDNKISAKSRVVVVDDKEGSYESVPATIKFFTETKMFELTDDNGNVYPFGVGGFGFGDDFSDDFGESKAGDYITDVRVHDSIITQSVVEDGTAVISVKTIGGKSIFGDGDIPISGGTPVTKGYKYAISYQSTNATASEPLALSCEDSSLYLDIEHKSFGMRGCTFSASNAFAVGNQSDASGNYSVALNGSVASGIYSLSAGCDAVASSHSAMALGYECKAQSPYSFAAGCNAEVASGITATGAYSIGYHTLSDSRYMMSTGQYNLGSTEGRTALSLTSSWFPLFVVGDGSSYARRNAFSVWSDMSTGHVARAFVGTNELATQNWTKTWTAENFIHKPWMDICISVSQQPDQPDVVSLDTSNSYNVNGWELESSSLGHDDEMDSDYYEFILKKEGETDSTISDKINKSDFSATWQNVFRIGNGKFSIPNVYVRDYNNKLYFRVFPNSKFFKVTTAMTKYCRLVAYSAYL